MEYKEKDFVIQRLDNGEVVARRPIGKYIKVTNELVIEED